MDDAEVHGLLALMLLHHARRRSRTRPDGSIVPLADQDRTQWDTALIAEGIGIAQAALSRDQLGEYQAQAAIAALHADAPRVEETDWVQIVEWYDELLRFADTPIVRLNRAVAVGEADGAPAGLAALAEVDEHVPRREAVAAYLHEKNGDLELAARLYTNAARNAPNLAERDHQTRQARDSTSACPLEIGPVERDHLLHDYVRTSHSPTPCEPEMTHMAPRNEGRPARRRRASWVWTVEAPDEIIEFATQVGLDELFVHVPWAVDVDPARAPIVQLASAARQRGIRVAALGGAPEWVDDPAAVVSGWLNPALALGVFEAVHLDVEPDFTDIDGGSLVVERFLALVRLIATSMPDGLELEADVRFSYPEIPAGDTDLASQLLAIVDAVTVLSYRNTTGGDDGSIALTRPTARLATAAGRGFRVGQETLDLGSAPNQRKQTFHGRPRAELEAAMSSIDASFGGSAAYLGAAVHDWRGYRQLRA